MSFINASLPPRIASGFRGGPLWNTLLVPYDNGREQSNKQWLYPKYRFSAATAVWTQEECQELLAFFMVTAGRWGKFRFRDPTDNRAINEPIAPNIGTSDPLQLVKTYTAGAGSMTRLIQATVAGKTTIYKDGVPVAGTMDDDFGKFTPSSPWAAGTYTWSGPFEIWVRSDNDWGAFTAVTDRLFSADIDLIEVRR